MNNRLGITLFFVVCVFVGPCAVAKQHVSLNVDRSTHELAPLLRDAIVALNELRSVASEKRLCTVRLRDNSGREIELVEQHDRIDHWWSFRGYLTFLGSGAVCFMLGLMIGNLLR